MKAKLLTLTLVLALAGLAPAGALADDDGGGSNNIVVATNKHDGADVFRAKLKITWVDADVVDNVNAAVAAASCVGCRTRAVALHLVLVTGNPHTVVPQNVAVAVNDRCSECVTFAYAYQGVFSADEDSELTETGEARIAAVRKALRALRESTLGPDELRTELDALAAELKDIVKKELVADDEDDAEDTDVDEDAQPEPGIQPAALAALAA